jgi:hypothetical protein
MSQESQPSKPGEPTPEQLLKLLDLQIAASRAKRDQAAPRRGLGITVALLLVIVAIVGALLVLRQMVAEMPAPKRTNDKPVETQKSQ